MKKEIYLAGGCFWGTQKYFDSIRGVLETETGYANGNTENPTYEEVCNIDTGFAETVKVVYHTDYVGLPFILDLYYDIIDPISVNRQGGDIGSQYRTGIYYTDDKDKDVILESISKLQEKHTKPIAIEVEPLNNYYTAEDFHQGYLDRNPSGYCHIGTSDFIKASKVVDKK